MSTILYIYSQVVRRGSWCWHRAITAAVVLIFATACNTDSSLPGDNEPDETVGTPSITVSALVGQPETRAQGTGHQRQTEVGTVFTAGCKSTLFLREAGNVERNSDLWLFTGNTPFYLMADGNGYFTWYNNIECTRRITRFWPANGNSVYFYAWYPAGWVTALGNENAITVAFDQGAVNGDEPNDLLFGTPIGGNPVAPTADAVPLIFRHRLAKVVVNLTSNNTNIGDILDNNCTVKLGDDLYAQATVNGTNGAVTTNTAGTTGTFVLKDAGVEGFTVSNFCLIPPQPLTGKKIHIEREGNTSTFIIPNYLGAVLNAASGYVYTFNLRIHSGKPIQVISVDVAAWGANETEINF